MSLLKYFSSLPRAALDRLYDDGWTCQGIVRALPPLARQYVMRLACVPAGLPLAVVDAWAKPSREARAKHDETLSRLRMLNLVTDGEPAAGGGGGGGGGATLRLHASFAARLLDSLCVGGVVGGDGDGASGSSSGAPTAAQLAQHAHATWEAVLSSVISPPEATVPLAMPCEGASLQELLSEADILRATPAGDDDGTGPSLVMSPDARPFLLWPTSRQVWRLVKAYMDLSERGKAGTRHATLCFIMRLGLLRVGRGYALDDPSLDRAQKATLADFALLGLVMLPKATPTTYYATPLAQHLLSAAGGGGGGPSAAAPSAASAAGSMDPGSAGSHAGGCGFVVLETNFRLYAYTASRLWAQVLAIFMRVEYLLPNLIVGTLNRESIQSAVAHGVSAADIKAFLERNAHPCMAAQVPTLPETVLNQIYLWVKERHRISFGAAKLYKEFDSRAEFDAAHAYARDNGVLLWSRADPQLYRCKLAVSAGAHERMREYLKGFKARAAAG